MGMFDSFYVEIEGREVELQTKRFDCVLDYWHLGDTVGGAPAGLRVYVDGLRLDAEGRQVYGEPRGPTRDWTVFLVIAHGVFVHCEVVGGLLPDPETAQRIAALGETWSDSARLLLRFASHLAAKGQTNRLLGARIATARRAIDEARRLRRGEPLDGPLGIVRDSAKRLQQGDDPLDVIESALADDSHPIFWGVPPGPPDPLAEHRL
jgi:hypothetical protein